MEWFDGPPTSAVGYTRSSVSLRWMGAVAVDGSETGIELLGRVFLRRMMLNEHLIR